LKVYEHKEAAMAMSSRSRWGRFAVLFAGLAAVALLAACGRTVEASGDVARGPATGDAINVIADDNVFKPDVLELDEGSKVTVEMTNEGNEPHNFTVEELDLSTGTIEPGKTATATFTVPGESTPFVCTLHAGMDGSIEVAGAR
jgi:plastocyanin